MASTVNSVPAANGASGNAVNSSTQNPGGARPSLRSSASLKGPDAGRRQSGSPVDGGQRYVANSVRCDPMPRIFCSRCRCSPHRPSVWFDRLALPSRTVASVHARVHGTCLQISCPFRALIGGCRQMSFPPSRKHIRVAVFGRTANQSAPYSHYLLL